MGFKVRKTTPTLTKEQKLEQAVKVLTNALEKYANSYNWGVQDHSHCYDCHCPLVADVYSSGFSYEDGYEGASDALMEVYELLEEA